MTSKAFQVGELIDSRYRVLSVIDSKGSDKLYRVSDETIEGEIVALKTFTVEPAETAIREIQDLAQLRHSNLASIYECGVLGDSQLYFTREWVEGQPLDLSLHRLEPAATIPVMVQICRALAYLHARGLIHGALKPSNVLLVDDRVHVTDFGLPLVTGLSEAQARHYAPGYTAPEVSEGGTGNYLADLYSLGALWYAHLVGEPPVFVQGALLIQLSLTEVLEPHGQASLALGAVITRLLSASPKDRYPSANGVIAAVNKATGSAYALETREAARQHTLRSRFVDREAELSVLQETWEQTRAGEGKLVLIGGESGTGKTRLVEEFIVQADLEGARVVRGQCVENDGTAYRPWREVLRMLMSDVKRSNWSGLEKARVGPTLATLLPELWDRIADLSPLAELEPQAAQQRLNSSIAQVLRVLAESRPIVVVIEDAHWADDATLTLLDLAAQVSRQTSLLVCATYDLGEVKPDHSLVTLTGEGIQRFPLQGLPLESTTDMVRSMLDLEKLPALLTEQLQQTTGGNPFFVQELIRLLAEDGDVLRRMAEGWRVDDIALEKMTLPPSIQRVIGERLAHLSVEAQQVLCWAAIVGPVCWEGAVAEVGQVSRAEVQAALGEGLAQELIVERAWSVFAGEREYIFVNSTVQKAIYEAIPQAERQTYHGRAAAWLVVHSGDKAGEYLGLIASHLEESGQTEQTVAYLKRAGEQAAAQFANAGAIAYLSHALKLTPKDDLAGRYALLLAREAIHHLQGARDAQAKDLDALEHLAQVRQRPEEQAEVAMRRAEFALVTGDHSAAIQPIQVAIAQAQAAGDLEQEIEAQLQWSAILARQGEFNAAREHTLSTLALAQTSGRRDLESLALSNLGGITRNLGDYAGAWDQFEQSLAITREIGDRQAEGRSLLELALITRFTGDHSRSQSYYEQILHLFRETGDRSYECVTFLNLGAIARSLGDYIGAQGHLKQALAIAREIGDRDRESLSLYVLGTLDSAQGDYTRARDYTERAVGIAREINNRMDETYALHGLA